ncbi:MAG TPA: imidazole glycerol phosphate synthase subunit HisH [Oscillospiraceae bacterium]|nr:imidazole glycerol phosphate synthase subunit HisH [Oscillospiraceae bacterium]
MKYAAIVDYGAGNLMSVRNALDYLGLQSMVTGDKDEIGRAAGVILPGVGAFPAGMAALRKSGLVPVLQRAAAEKPLLGICLGMQFLLTESEEIAPAPGLGLIPGRVRRIQTALKLPQIGWNSLSVRKKDPLLAGVPDGSYVYFVHSFAAEPEEKEDVAAVCDYGGEVTAMVSRGTVFGCQFHPEKSGETGLAILRNFQNLL